MPISYLFDWGIPRHSVVHIEIAYIRISCYSVIDKVLHWVGLDIAKRADQFILLLF